MAIWPFKKKPTVEEMNSTNIGEVLLKLGAIDEDELRDAVAEQVRTASSDTPKKLGEILVSRGRLTEGELHMALALQHEMRTKTKTESVMSMAETQTLLMHERAGRCRSTIEMPAVTLALAAAAGGRRS